MPGDGHENGPLVAFMPPKQEPAIMAKWARYPRLYLFGVGGMTYALFFDEAGRLRDYLIWPTVT